MADPTIPIPPPSQAVQAALVKELNQVLATIGTVQSLPANLPQPDRTVVLTGTVLQLLPQPGNGQSSSQGSARPQVAVIQTALGTLTLNLTAAIQPGPITLQIQPGSPPVVAMLATPPAGQPAVASQAANQVPLPLVETPSPNTVVIQTLPATPASPVAVGQVLNGMFTPSAPVPTASPPAPPLASAVMQLPTAPLSPLAGNPSLLAQETASEEGGSPGVVLTPSAPVVAVPQVYRVVGITPPGPSLAITPAAQQASLPPGSPQPASLIPASIAVTTASPPTGGGLSVTPADTSASEQPPAEGLSPLSTVPLPSNPGTVPSSPAAAVTPLATPVTVPSPSPSPSLSSPTPAAPPPVTASPQPAAAVANSPAAIPAAPPSALPTAASNIPPAAMPVSATVVASTSTQQPVLSVPNGVIFITEPIAVHPGTTLSLQVLTPGEASSLQPALPGTPAPISRDSWPALQQTLTSLAGNPAAAAALAKVIPSLGPDFVSTFIAYLTKAGGIEKPSAEDAQTILRTLKLDEASVPGLRAALEVLQGEVLGKSTSPVSSQGWQSFPVPLLTGSGLSLIQVYLHQQIESRQDEANLKSGFHNTTRFLLEVHPSALGPVQLDGLLRRDLKQAQAAPDHLDLIVRSEAGIPSEDAQELQGLFINALEASGLTGRLSFQYGRENFIQPASGAGSQIEVTA